MTTYTDLHDCCVGQARCPCGRAPIGLHEANRYRPHPSHRLEFKGPDEWTPPPRSNTSRVRVVSLVELAT